MSQAFKVVPTREEADDPNEPATPKASLVGRVREVHKSSSGVKEFLLALIALIVGTLVGTIILSISAVIPLSMLIFGIVYSHNCPAEPYIPIYLIVAGGFGVLKELLEFFARCEQRKRKQEQKRSGKEPEAKQQESQQTPLDNVISCFLFAWFIAGCVWIYSAYEPEYVDASSDRYCNKTLYLFSFWITTSVFIILGFGIFFLCCVCAGFTVLGRNATRDKDSEP